MHGNVALGFQLWQLLLHYLMHILKNPCREKQYPTAELCSLYTVYVHICTQNLQKQI